MRKLPHLLSTLLLSTLSLLPSCAAPATHHCPTTAAIIPLTPPVAQEVSLEQLKRLLPSHPLVVGFDVDDTLIFSAPAFNALQPNYDPAIIRPKDYAALTPEQKAQYHDFWDKLNNTYDDRSLPKKIGQQLLDLHLARHDTIFIISRRQSSVGGFDPCTPRYEKMFHIHLDHPVIQTQLQDKTPFICKAHIDYYYGDSDSDITAAVAAGAIPIRVKRSPNSYAKDTPHNGQLNEIVLQNSED